MFALAIRFRRLVVRLVSGAVAITLSMTAGMAVVNDYYGYYQTWTALGADLTGSYASFTSATAGRLGAPVEHGRVESVRLPGARSGIDRQALVYLPPQY